MLGATKTSTQAGIFIFTKISAKRNNETKGRRKKENPTSEEVRKLNEIYAIRDLNIKLHHNFAPGDMHLVLTYKGAEPTLGEAKKKISNFKRDLAKLYKKNGKEVKWIEATEYKNKRIHHHMIINKFDARLIQEIWQHGYVRPSYLDDTNDWRALASYIIKETRKTFAEDRAYGKRRFRCSRTIKNPVSYVEDVSLAQILLPKPSKGYYIEKDSMYEGKTVGNNKPYIDYVQIALEEPRKIRRGKKREYQKEKYIKWEDEQLTFDSECFCDE